MKLAIVTPWFGRELKGGAEQLAWQLASRFAQRNHDVDVLTTCCRSHQDDWATNHFPADAYAEPEGFTTRRFPVQDRDRAAFDRVCAELQSLPPSGLKRGVSPIAHGDSSVFVHGLIKSPALLSYLEARRHTYDWFILLPYLYGPVLEGIEILQERAALQPCLHDEAYAYLPQVAGAFRVCGRLLFNSDGEEELAFRLFGPDIWSKSTVVGSGVEATRIPAPSLTNGSSPDDTIRPYVLYLGRKDTGKNVPMLVRAFRRFREVRPNSQLRLLLAGNGKADLGGVSDAMEDLGLVDEARKEHLLQHCHALFQPSANESFSRVMMEAWMKGKPVGAHSSCLATAVAVQRSRGGWLADSEEEWAALFVEVSRLPQSDLVQLGERGRVYAETWADWDQVIERYENALAPAPPSSPDRPARKRREEINQFLPNLSSGDAISNHALWIRNQLRDLGFDSEIYARFIDPRLMHECHVFVPEKLHKSAGAIYHHSIGTEITPHLLDFAGPKCLIYHNITPAEFFEPYRPEFAALLQGGRSDLGSMAEQFPISFGDSEYNASELRGCGFENPRVLPIAIDPAYWSMAPDESLMAELQDGRTNLLFVGRIAPNKKQDDLLRAFAHYLALDCDARLILVGKAEEADPYAELLHEMIRGLGLGDSVVLPGSIEEAQLAAYYRTAYLFWSMSEHEGFCVPLIEAMWFDIPVLAYKSSAVPGTLGTAGLMFNDKRNLAEVAALAHLLVMDSSLSAKVIARGRGERERYLPGRVAPRLLELAESLCSAVERRKA